MIRFCRSNILYYYTYSIFDWFYRNCIWFIHSWLNSWHCCFISKFVIMWFITALYWKLL